MCAASLTWYSRVIHFAYEEMNVRIGDVDYGLVFTSDSGGCATLIYVFLS